MSGSSLTDRRNGHTKAKVVRTAFVTAKESPGQNSLYIVPKRKSKGMFGCCSRDTVLFSAILGNADSCQQCDGQRLPCQRRVGKNLTCVYDVEPDISRLTSLRRKNDILEIKFNELHRFDEYIRTCSDPDAYKIFRRIRTSSEPFDITRLLKIASAL